MIRFRISSDKGKYARQRAVAFSGFFLLAFFSVSGCIKRIPVVYPPPAGVEAVEGTGHGLLKGNKVALKGRFAFVCRASGQGRIEAFDPLGRSAFILLTEGEREYLIIPAEKIYAEGEAGVFAARFLGLAMGPRQILGLLSGRPAESGFFESGAWRLESDSRGRIKLGEKEGFVFEVSRYFEPGTVPREIRFRLGTEGKLILKSVRFNTVSGAGAFDTAFLARFTKKTADELEAWFADEN